MRSKVAITRCCSYSRDAVSEAVRTAVDLLGGIETFVKKGDKVLIKPNLLSGNPPGEAVTTHPEIIRAVVELVKKAGGIPGVGDSPGIGSLGKVALKAGVKRILDEMNVPLVDFNDMVTADNRAGYIFKRFEVARAVMEADIIINLPKIKTHGQMLLTLAVKNNFGCIGGTKKAQWHLMAGVDRLLFAHMLLDLYLLINPELTVVDGIVGMEGDGPSSGVPREIGIILSGTDCVAADVVLSEILGIARDDLPTTRAAVIRRLPGVDLGKIDIRGEKLNEVKLKNFILSSVRHVGWNLPPFFSRSMVNLLSSRPRIDQKKCELCGACVKSCPPKIMRLEKKQVIIDYKRCIRCFCCHELCPRGAVKIQMSLIRRLFPGLAEKFEQKS